VIGDVNKIFYLLQVKVCRYLGQGGRSANYALFRNTFKNAYSR
jgi:hypothetical protein